MEDEEIYCDNIWNVIKKGQPDGVPSLDDEGKIPFSELPDSGSVDLSDYYKKDDIDDKLNDKSNTEHSHTAEEITDLASVAKSGSYDDLDDKPTIPDITGKADKTYVDTELSKKTTDSTLKTVAKTGSYNDLSDKPSIPTVPNSLPANGGNADTVDGLHLVTISETDYTNLSSKASNTVYLRY